MPGEGRLAPRWSSDMRAGVEGWRDVAATRVFSVSGGDSCCDARILALARSPLAAFRWASLLVLVLVFGSVRGAARYIRQEPAVVLFSGGDRRGAREGGGGACAGAGGGDGGGSRAARRNLCGVSRTWIFAGHPVLPKGLLGSWQAGNEVNSDTECGV